MLITNDQQILAGLRARTLVTGPSGAGKSRIAHIARGAGWKAYDIDDFSSEIKGKSQNYWICDWSAVPEDWEILVGQCDNMSGLYHFFAVRQVVFAFLPLKTFSLVMAAKAAVPSLKQSSWRQGWQAKSSMSTGKYTRYIDTKKHIVREMAHSYGVNCFQVWTMDVADVPLEGFFGWSGVIENHGKGSADEESDINATNDLALQGDSLYWRTTNSNVVRAVLLHPNRLNLHIHGGGGLISDAEILMRLILQGRVASVSIYDAASAGVGLFIASYIRSTLDSSFKFECWGTVFGHSASDPVCFMANWNFEKKSLFVSDGDSSSRCLNLWLPEDLAMYIWGSIMEVYCSDMLVTYERPWGRMSTRNLQELVDIIRSVIGDGIVEEQACFPIIRSFVRESYSKPVDEPRRFGN